MESTASIGSYLCHYGSISASDVIGSEFSGRADRAWAIRSHCGHRVRVARKSARDATISSLPRHGMVFGISQRPGGMSKQWSVGAMVDQLA